MVEMNTLVSLCKRRGLIFQSSEIYGGINSCWDYGPLGVELKNNIKKFWWERLTRRDDIVGIDTSILMHAKVWQASGHVEGFVDPLVDCKSCKQRFKADALKDQDRCPDCGGELTLARKFNLMFKTFMGPVEDQASLVYLRPETAQGIYVNFLNVQTSLRKKLPFGIAQIGKAFRNEITPGNFIFRTREFEQMEMQYFIHPQEDKKWMSYWQEERLNWYLSLGFNKEKLRFHQHEPHALAHYAKEAFDIEYEFPFGWQELEGIHHRGDFDLGAHQKYSGKNLTYFDEETKERFIPYIIETSAGCDRTLLALLIDVYQEEEVKGEKRVFLKLKQELAPIKIAFLPLSKDEKIMEMTHQVHDILRASYISQYDDAGSIGRRYRRQDEVGTPYCVTIDFDSLKDKKVTVRHRDSMKQDRIDVDSLKKYFSEKFGGN